MTLSIKTLGMISVAFAYGLWLNVIVMTGVMLGVVAPYVGGIYIKF